MQRFALTDPAAVCNDNSRAVYFYRNCTANADRKPGDPDFCAKSDEGVAEFVWFIMFAQSEIRADDESAALSGLAGGWCSDGASCVERSRLRPNLTSSRGLPDAFYPNGALSSFPEQNPNFYKQQSVVVPYCSSDLFLGDALSAGFQFRGRRILSAVFRDLVASKGFARADRVVIIGGPGVIAQADAIRALLPTSVANVHFVCDGCLLFDIKPFALATVKRSRLPTLPPARSIAQGFALWRAELPASSACRANTSTAERWSCLFAPRLLQFAPAPGVLVQQPQFDAFQLAALNAWPPSAANRAFILAFARRVRETLANHPRAPFVFSAACHEPLAFAGSQAAYFRTDVR